MWASAPDDVWFAGTQGDVLHTDGQTWTLHDGLVDGALQGLWGFGPDDLWVAGEGGAQGTPLLHWDGVGWTRNTVVLGDEDTDHRTVVGIPDGGVWVGGEHPSLGSRAWTWTGVRWEVEHPLTLSVPRDLWRTSDGVIWGAAKQGGVETGAGWILGLAAVDDGVLAVGNTTSPTVAHASRWTEGGWLEMRLPDGGTVLNGVTETADGRRFAVGQERDGLAWTLEVVDGDWVEVDEGVRGRRALGAVASDGGRVAVVGHAGALVRTPCD